MSNDVAGTGAWGGGRTHAGRVALVTGSGSGIGRAIARRLAAEGAPVGCLDVDGEAAATTVETIAGAGGRALALSADVRDRAAVAAAVATAADQLGALELLVNAAGLVTMTGFDDLQDEEWDAVVDVNLKGYFIVAQEAVKRFAERGGAIVNISTVEADVVVSSTGHCQVHYNASKGGVKMLTKALAAELSGRGIRVNAVAPGVINTGFSGLDLQSDAAQQFLNSRLLIERLGEPEDIAAAVNFLLSDDASFVTGIQLPVDGGWLVR
ncbi:MAG: SDR family NAD(P)-dependent oxidoreductase [Solirubrobacterales bacterium]